MNIPRNDEVKLNGRVDAFVDTQMNFVIAFLLSVIFMGLLPIAVGTGAGGASRRSIATVAVGGQLLYPLITLLVTPVVYTRSEGAKVRLGIRRTSWQAWRPGVVREV